MKSNENIVRIRRILEFAKPYKWGFIVSGLLMLLFTASNVYLIPLTDDLSSEIGHQNLRHLSFHVLNACLLFAVRLCAQFGQLYITTKLTNQIVIDMRIAMYRKLQGFSQTFYGEWKLGDLLTRLFSDTDKVFDAIKVIFADVAPQLFTFFGVFGYLFYLNWKLTIFMLVEIPIFVGIISFTSGLMKKATRQVQRKSADITHIAQETLTNVKLVQAYTQEEREIRRFSQENKRSFAATMKGVIIRTRVEPIISFLQFISFALIIWYGGYQVATGTMTAPELASFCVGGLLLIDPVLALSKGAGRVQQAFVSVDRFFEIMDATNDVTSASNAKKLKRIEGEVELKDLYFTYPNTEEPVLDHINVTAKPGEVIALVGLSGAGKTTLINLIPRFFDPTEGVVLVDGHDIRKVNLHSLRSQIGIVPQEDILFRGTIFENVRYGKSDASEEDVIDALKQANAWEFVNLMPGKVFSKVGDRGRRLSGGQKQRISIARAILKDPRILILDEATSALDSKSEKLVQDALERLMKSRTTFVIAHRLSTIMSADKIVVLDKGKIVEMGSHSELLKEKGHYAALYNMQFRKEA